MKQKKTMKARYKGYCNACQYTIFQNETIAYNGRAYHLDCKKALSDKYPRSLNPAYEALIGRVHKAKLRKMIEERATR